MLDTVTRVLVSGKVGLESCVMCSVPPPPSNSVGLVLDTEVATESVVLAVLSAGVLMDVALRIVRVIIIIASDPCCSTSVIT